MFQSFSIPTGENRIRTLGGPKKLIKKSFWTKLFNALFASTNTELGHNEEQGAPWFLNITIISYSLTQKVTKIQRQGS